MNLLDLETALSDVRPNELIFIAESTSKYGNPIDPIFTLVRYAGHQIVGEHGILDRSKRADGITIQGEVAQIGFENCLNVPVPKFKRIEGEYVKLARDRSTPCIDDFAVGPDAIKEKLANYKLSYFADFVTKAADPLSVVAWPSANTPNY